MLIVFVSDWIIDKSTLQVVSGGDLIQNVYGWNTGTQSSDASPTAGWSFNRFCFRGHGSGKRFLQSSSGLGTQSRLLLNGEEGGAAGYAVATALPGPVRTMPIFLAERIPPPTAQAATRSHDAGADNLSGSLRSKI
jgi:hypothetical protein